MIRYVKGDLSKRIKEETYIYENRTIKEDYRRDLYI